MEKTSTVAMALAFTKSEEIGAIQSTVAWAMAAMDLRLGWTAPVKSGMDGKTAIKVLRESHGYRKDTDGNPVLDAKGNRSKRSAVFNRLAIVEKLVSYMAKTMPAYVTELHHAALYGDSDNMQSTVCSIGGALCDMAGDDTLDALTHFLTTGKKKEKVDPVSNPVEALQEGESAPPATPEAPATHATPATFGDVLAWLTQNKMGMSSAQWESVLTMGTAEMLQRSEIAALEEAEKVAA